MVEHPHKSTELIPPPHLAPPALFGTTMEQRIVMWGQLMDLAEQFLLAGLRRRIGPEGDLAAAYRQWYEQRMEDHDRDMLQRKQRCERVDDHGC